LAKNAASGAIAASADWIIPFAEISVLIFAVRMTSLCVTTKQRLMVAVASIFMLVAAVVLGIVKHQSDLHAIVLFGVAVLSFAFGTLGVGADLKDFYKARAAGDFARQISAPTSRRMIWQIMVSIVLLLACYYILL
jgi:hypothetical protein